MGCVILVGPTHTNITMSWKTATFTTPPPHDLCLHERMDGFFNLLFVFQNENIRLKTSSLQWCNVKKRPVLSLSLFKNIKDVFRV